MAFDPRTASGRVRAAVGDTSDPPLINDGERRYDFFVSSEPTEAAAMLRAARELEAEISLQPVRTGAGGLSVDYSGRLTFLRRVIGELAGAVDASAAASPLQFVPVVYRDASATDEFSR